MTVDSNVDDENLDNNPSISSITSDIPDATNAKGRLTSIGDHYGEKLTSDFFFTIRGSENVHIYWWVAKDLGWTLGNRILGMTSGVLAMLWVGVLLYNAVVANCTEDAYMLLPMFLWLFGNFWWMDGELINDDDNIQAPEGGYCMLAGIILIILYHICLKPLKLLKDDPKMTKLCKDCNLIPRFSYFSTWRQYEHFHTLLWLAKDYSWNNNNPYAYLVFMVPTVLVAFDFIYVSIKLPRNIIDTVHYVVQLLWVLANAVWSTGELFAMGPDLPVPLFRVDNTAINTSRWYSAAILFSCFVLLFLFYAIWVPLTYYNKIVEMEHIRLSEYAANVEVNKNSTPVLKAKSGLVQEPDHEIDEEFGMTKTKNPLQK